MKDESSGIVAKVRSKVKNADVIIDLYSFQYIWMSDHALKITEYKSGEITGKHLTYVANINSETITKAVGELLSGKLKPISKELKTKSGKIIIVSAEVKIITIDGTPHAVASNLRTE